MSTIFRVKIGDHEGQCVVPDNVKGIKPIAEYIAKEQSHGYAEGMCAQKEWKNSVEEGRAYQKYYQSYYNANRERIEELLISYGMELQQKLKDMRDKRKAREEKRGFAE